MNKLAQIRLPQCSPTTTQVTMATLEKLENTDKQDGGKKRINIISYSIPKLICVSIVLPCTHAYLKRLICLYPGSRCSLLFYIE